MAVSNESRSSQAAVPKRAEDSHLAPTSSTAPENTKNASQGLATVSKEQMQPHPVPAAQNEDILVVGISGATSSGKTTLALILAEIFTTPDMAPPISLGHLAHSNNKNGLDSQAKTTKSKSNLLIHQDLFFFNKGAAECTSFSSKQADDQFCRESVENDEIGEYGISKVKNDIFNISGPDTDHLSALNMWGLLKAIQWVKKTGELPEVEVWTDEGVGHQLSGYGMPCHIRITTEDIDKVRTKYGEIIASERTRVKQWINKVSEQNKRQRVQSSVKSSVIKSCSTGSDPFIACKLLFIEGFLLYPRPVVEKRPTPSRAFEEAYPNDTKKENSAILHADASQKEDIVATKLLGDIARKLASGAIISDIELEFVQEHHYLALQKAFQQVGPLIDLKLFLSISKEDAKKRRMRRQEYRDPEQGGSRRPGQMWKTEGYFEEVAWKNHCLSHSWVIDWKGMPKKDVNDIAHESDVLMSDEVGSTIQSSIVWAVGAILERLGQIEASSRAK